jgi:hypothetical protein
MDIKTVGGKLIIEDKGSPIGNDIAIGTVQEMEKEYAERIIRADKGTFIMDPTLGAGITALLNGPTPAEEIKKMIRTNLKIDSFRIFGIEVVKSSQGKRTISVNATRRIEE